MLGKYWEILRNCWPEIWLKFVGDLPEDWWTLIIPEGWEGGVIIIFCRKIVISPEPNLCWTSDQFVSSSLSVAVQEKKPRALYLSRLKRGGPMKFENTFFQIAKLRFSSIFVDFRKKSRIFKKFSWDQFKS